MQLTLKRIKLKYTGEELSEDFLKDNQYIEELTILDGFKEIPERAFCDCSNLKKVEIQGESVKRIGYSAFDGCKNLVDVKLNEGLEEIYWGAFFYCKKLPRIEIPNSVKRIGNNVFYGCETLQTINIDNTETFVKTNWDTNWLGDCQAKVNCLRGKY
jgi:hypothetical protein